MREFSLRLTIVKDRVVTLALYPKTEPAFERRFARSRYKSFGFCVKFLWLNRFDTSCSGNLTCTSLAFVWDGDCRLALHGEKMANQYPT